MATAPDREFIPVTIPDSVRSGHRVRQAMAGPTPVRVVRAPLMEGRIPVRDVLRKAQGRAIVRALQAASAQPEDLAAVVREAGAAHEAVDRTADATDRLRGGFGLPVKL